MATPALNKLRSRLLMATWVSSFLFLSACQASEQPDAPHTPTLAAEQACGQTCDEQCAESCDGLDEGLCARCESGSRCQPACQCDQRCPASLKTVCRSCQVYACSDGQHFAEDACHLLAKACACAPGQKAPEGSKCYCAFWACGDQTLSSDVHCELGDAQDCALCGSDETCPQPMQEVCEPAGCTDTPDPDCVESSTCDDVDAACSSCRTCREGCTDDAACPSEPDPEPSDPEPTQDDLDQVARQIVTRLRRVGPAGDAESKRLSLQAVEQALRLVDGMPSDLELSPDADLKPHLVALGRAWSTLALIDVPPIGTLPNGGLCPDLLEGTQTDPNTPVLSQLFNHLPFQDDDERQTRAVYALAELQSLIGCLNKTELLALDLGLSESLLTLLRRLAQQHKSALGLALLDHALPVSLLVFDAAKSYYMPRSYRVLTLRKKFWAEGGEMGGEGFAERAFGIPRGVSIERVPFADTSVQRLYCERPPTLYTLSRFGIWLADPTHGKRLHRLHLNKAAPCGFLQRSLELVRLGDGSCSLTEFAYAGFQCRSEHTCNLAKSDDYKIGALPGSTLSPLNQFGLSKAGVRPFNCDIEGALGDGSSGWLTSRPTSECMVSNAAFEDAPETFGECLQRSDGVLVGPVDRGADPWAGECGAIDCAEGESCTSEPPAEAEDEPAGDPNDPPGDPDGDGDDDDDHDGKKDEDASGESCDVNCRVHELATNGKSEMLEALNTFNQGTCPGCVRPDAAANYEQLVTNLPDVTLVYGATETGGAGETKTSPDGTSSTVTINTDWIRGTVNERTALDFGFDSVEACLDNAVCADVAERRFEQGVSFALTHELQHVVVDAMVISGAIFNASGAAFFDMFDQGFEDAHGKVPMGCSQGLGVGCSADHGLIWSWWRLLPVNHGRRSCTVDGACGDDCGPPKSKSEMCREETELAHAAYVERLRNLCPAPRINERIEPECRLPGCFGDGLPDDPPVCRFALCNGSQELSVDLACSCCSTCQSGPPPAATGESPSCRGEVECRGCCINCGVPAGELCPFAADAPAPQLPPAWQPL